MINCFNLVTKNNVKNIINFPLYGSRIRLVKCTIPLTTLTIPIGETIDIYYSVPAYTLNYVVNFPFWFSTPDEIYDWFLSVLNTNSATTGVTWSYIKYGTYYYYFTPSPVPPIWTVDISANLATILGMQTHFDQTLFGIGNTKIPILKTIQIYNMRLFINGSELCSTYSPSSKKDVFTSFLFDQRIYESPYKDIIIESEDINKNEIMEGLLPRNHTSIADIKIIMEDQNGNIIDFNDSFLTFVFRLIE